MQFYSLRNLQVVRFRHIDCHSDFITATICLSEVVGRAVAHDAAINHDTDLVAELFGFVHSVSGQQNAGVTELFYHFK